MIRRTILSSLLLSNACFADILSESDILAPKDLRINKWVFTQATDTETVAVMKVRHSIGKEVVESYEEIFYAPERPVLGTLLIFNDHSPITIKLPTSNTIHLHVDKRWQSLGSEKGVVKGVDGVERPCESVVIDCAREKIVVSFYSAPMKIFRATLPKMPNPKNDNTSSFTWRREIVSGTFYVTKTELDGKETIKIHRAGDKTSHPIAETLLEFSKLICSLGLFHL